MIKVKVSKNAEGIYNKVCLEGHAGYAPYGEDIVCAAISALVINTINSIEQFTEDEFNVTQDEKTDRFEFEVTSSISEETKLLLNSLMLGLRQIENDYNREYLEIILKEV